MCVFLRFLFRSYLLQYLFRIKTREVKQRRMLGNRKYVLFSSKYCQLFLILFLSNVLPNCLYEFWKMYVYFISNRSCRKHTFATVRQKDSIVWLLHYDKTHFIIGTHLSWGIKMVHLVPMKFTNKCITNFKRWYVIAKDYQAPVRVSM